MTIGIHTLDRTADLEEIGKGLELEESSSRKKEYLSKTVELKLVKTSYLSNAV